MIRFQSFVLIVISSLLTLSIAHAEDAFFDSNGVKLHYTVQGSGEPVLLIHGYTASARLNWELPRVTTLLAQNYKVIAYDNRGHGQSDKPLEEKLYGIQMVEDAVRLLDHLKIQKAHVVGYSMGGMITLKLLTVHPDRVISAVVGGMGWYGATGLPARDPEDEPTGQEPKALRACILSWGELRVSKEQVMAIKTPMTVLIGANDPILHRYVKPLQDVRPDILVSIIDGANHTGCCFRPQFKEALKTFLDQHRQSGAVVGSGGQ